MTSKTAVFFDWNKTEKNMKLSVNKQKSSSIQLSSCSKKELTSVIYCYILFIEQEEIKNENFNQQFFNAADL